MFFYYRIFDVSKYLKCINSVRYPFKDVVQLWNIKNRQNWQLTVISPVLHEAFQHCVVFLLDVLHEIRVLATVFDPLCSIFTGLCVRCVVSSVEKHVHNRSIWELSIPRSHFNKSRSLMHAFWTWDCSGCMLQGASTWQAPDGKVSVVT